jgi:hydroxymethylbilane synthase
MTPEALRLGTRGSKLALAQSQQVADQLSAATGRSVRLVVIRTRGDQIQDRPLHQIGGKGLFTAELEDGLREGSIDFAVHSLKDLPTEDSPGLCIGAVPRRADPRDALIGPRLEELLPGARVATGSPRRRLQLRALRPDLQLAELRGNIDTRLGKLDRREHEAIVLAMAGLLRLGVERPDVQPLEPDVFLPAPGQGALGLQCRAADAATLELLSMIEHAPTRAAVQAERSFLAAWGGGCSAPVAAYAEEGEAGMLRLSAAVAGEGGAMRRAELLLPWGGEVGALVALLRA